jgi:hypothetical protein
VLMRPSRRVLWSLPTYAQCYAAQSFQGLTCSFVTLFLKCLGAWTPAQQATFATRPFEHELASQLECRNSRIITEFSETVNKYPHFLLL